MALVRQGFGIVLQKTLRCQGGAISRRKLDHFSCLRGYLDATVRSRDATQAPMRILRPARYLLDAITIGLVLSLPTLWLMGRIKAELGPVGFSMS